jgi:hypothetical protein
LCRNCLLKYVTEGKMGGRERRWTKKTGKYWITLKKREDTVSWKEEASDCNLWRTRFETSYRRRDDDDDDDGGGGGGGGGVDNTSSAKEETVPYPAANVDTPNLLPVALLKIQFRPCQLFKLPTFRKTVMPQFKVSKSSKVVVRGDTSMELRSAKGRFAIFTNGKTFPTHRGNTRLAEIPA